MRKIKRILLQLLIPLSAALLASCANQGTQPNGQPQLSGDDAKTSYTQGVAEYDEGHFDIALTKLQTAIDSGRLKPAQVTDARKHMAFIYCVTSREAECRAQFQAALQAEPDFDLSPGEIGHPLWGPVWRSIKGEHNEQLVLSRADASNATPAQHKLAEGVKQYQANQFKEAAVTLESSLKEGLPLKIDEILAHKYAAFSYCLENHTTQCRNEFRAIFALDANFELLPSEANHPVWSPIYRREQAAAKHTVQK